MDIKNAIKKIGTLKSVDEIDVEMNRIINSNPDKDDSYLYIYQTNGDLFSAIFAILVMSVMEALRTAKGSARDKVKCCDKLLRKCDRTIKRLEKQDTTEAKQELKKYNEARKKIIKEREYHSKRCVDMGWYASRHQEGNNMILNTYPNSNITANTLFVATDINTSDYTYSAMYEEYIQNKIDNERRLANHIKQYIPVTESAYKQISVIYEAKATDAIKAKWTKFIEFIKNMFAKFAEKITSILVDEKGYLEKYKKIILEKKPKPGNEYSIPGNYKEAINRCINTHVPLFNYEEFKDQLNNKDSNIPLAQKIISKSNSGYQFDSGETLAGNFKEYFLAHDLGTQSGTFDDGSLNFKDMYNFCYNSGKIKEITTKDENYLNQSTNAIVNYVNTELSKNSKTESAVFTEDTPPNGTGDSNPTSNPAPAGDKKDDLKSEIKNSNAISKMNSYEDRKEVTDDEKSQNANAAQNDNVTEENMNVMMQKWLDVCRALISAKLTAVQQISNDYMKIIRLHVQSYVNKNKNDADNRAKQQTASNYQKKDNSQKQQDTGGDTNPPGSSTK